MVDAIEKEVWQVGTGMEQQNVYTTWLCSSALGSLLAFLSVPRFAWGALFSVVFGWYAYKSLLSARARRVFLLDAACNAMVGLVVFCLSLMRVMGDDGRIIVVCPFVLVTAAVCWRICKLEVEQIESARGN